MQQQVNVVRVINTIETVRTEGINGLAQEVTGGIL